MRRDRGVSAAAEGAGERKRKGEVMPRWTPTCPPLRRRGVMRLPRTGPGRRREVELPRSDAGSTTMSKNSCPMVRRVPHHVFFQ